MNRLDPRLTRGSCEALSATFVSSPVISASHHRSVRFANRFWIILGGALSLFGCTTSPDADPNNLLSSAMAIEQKAAACYRTVATNTRYQHVSNLLPLAAPYRASIVQMANRDKADEQDIHALIAWTEDTQKCRSEVIGRVRQSAPTSLALVLSAWADEDAIFVSVIRRKLTWGAAATQLRSTQIKLFSSVTDRAIQVDAQLNSARQAELARRVDILDAITNLAP
jgi:hypothetical protein